MDQTYDRRAKLIRHHPCVIFNSSSTVSEAAYQIVEKGLKLTAVTVDIRIGEFLAGNGANGFHPILEK